MAPIVMIVMDVKDMKRASTFWTEALAYAIESQDENWTTLVDPRKKGLELGLQRPAANKVDTNRVHFDIGARDVAKEVARLEALGARRIPWDHYPPGARYVVMEDPEGNEFCVVRRPS
jgi:predicted enzyme related to lactoylglutathione lyase